MHSDRTFDHSDSKRDLSQYYCRAGFEWLAIWKKDKGAHMCCPEWLGVNLQEFKERFGQQRLKYDRLNDMWFGDNAKKIKKSLLDGSFKYCSRDCPNLQKLKYSDNERTCTLNGPIARKTKANGQVVDEAALLAQFPKTIFINIDESCNLSCPSCRSEQIRNSSNHSEELLKQIDEDFSATVERFHCTGAGDPFYSRACREWMMALDLSKYKKLSSFFIHTNAQLWTRDLWMKMPALHNLNVRSEISIDAANGDTYQYVRRGGQWERLQANLQWLSQDPQLKDGIRFSFVVQKRNHREMIPFIHMIRGLFPNAFVEFRKVQAWDRSDYGNNPQLFAEQAVHQKDHPEFEEFIANMQAIQSGFNSISHNFHDLLLQTPASNTSL